ncbi:dihydrofolate reductase [Pollutibacter soli]|uniref:dihydrofolate reductase n=1 Tax=Pollutibacter soli TaxID=3034157 RepID=UPI003013CC85
MIVSLVLAASEDNAIGKNNQLLWHLPNDMRFFKNTTWGMPVIMGRKTFEALAGEPLPGRFNIVVTRQRDWQANRPGVWVANTLESALIRSRETNCNEVYVIGGGEIYTQALPLADKIYLTRVHAKFPDADAHFEGFIEKEWSLKSRIDCYKDDKHAYDYSFETWERSTLVV